jgi:ABC-2 type transport system permease protein
MSTTATELSKAAPARAQDGKVTQLRVINSEWIKLRTLRSTPITLLVAVVIMIGLGPLLTWANAAHSGGGPGDHGAPVVNSAELSLALYHFAQLAIGVLGVLMVTGEYSTGMIRASMSAVPKRLPVLWAKAAVYAVVVLVLMTIASLVAFYTTAGP